MNITEQKEQLIETIRTSEAKVNELKETIKNSKIKLRKAEKIEKEIQLIFDNE